MFGLGMGEILVIAVVALLFLGPEKLPGAAKTLSKGIRDLRKHTRDLQRTLEDDTQVGEAIRDLKSAFRGDLLDEPYVPPTPSPEEESPPVTHTASVSQQIDHDDYHDEPPPIEEHNEPPPIEEHNDERADSGSAQPLTHPASETVATNEKREPTPAVDSHKPTADDGSNG